MSGQTFALTQAGNSVTNTASISYSVGGSNVGSATDDSTFKVDYKVDFSVELVSSEIFSSGTLPGATINYVFKVINEGNGGSDFIPNITDPALNSALTVAGTPNADVEFESITWFWDEDKSSTIDGGETKTYVDGLTYDDTTPGDNEAYIVAIVKLYELNNTNASHYNDSDTTDGIHNVDGFVGGLDFSIQAAPNYDTGVPTIVANGAEGTAYSALDITTAQAEVFNSATVQLVFADTGSDNTETKQGAIQIATPQLVVTKTMIVVDDFVSTSDYKAIPGAKVEYTISVENTGSVNADTYTISDDLTAVTGIDTVATVAITDNGSLAAATTQSVDNFGAGSNGEVEFTFTTPLVNGTTNSVKFTAFIK